MPPTTVPRDPYRLQPTGVNDIVDIGTRVKAHQSVLIDLGALPKGLRRRLLDICAGLTYGLGASMTRPAADHYLIEPQRPEQDHERVR